MNLKNYYWWFDSVIPSRVCDEIVKFGVSQNSQLAITGDFKDLKELTKEQENNLKKRRNSNVAFLMEPWIFKEIPPFINAANQNAGWNLPSMD